MIKTTIVPTKKDKRKKKTEIKKWQNYITRALFQNIVGNLGEKYDIRFTIYAFSYVYCPQCFETMLLLCHFFTFLSLSFSFFILFCWLDVCFYHIFPPVYKILTIKWKQLLVHIWRKTKTNGKQQLDNLTRIGSTSMVTHFQLPPCVYHWATRQARDIAISANSLGTWFFS